MSFSIEHQIARIIQHFRRLDRIGIVLYIWISYTLFLCFMAFNYTVLDGDFYKKAAYEQQTMLLKNAASRGSIYSSEDSLHGVLSVSTNLGNLAIDPSQDGSRTKLIVFLSDIVFDEYCTYSTSPCLENMANYLHEDITGMKDITVSAMKKKIGDYLTGKMDAPIESVLVQENLNETLADSINAWKDPSLFFVANNLYVNPTKVGDRNTLANRLANILWVSEEKILPKFEPKKRKHLDIIRKMSVSTRDAITKRMEAEQTAIKKLSGENRTLFLSGSIFQYIKIEDNLIRYYPERSIAGQITGFIDGGWVWRYGIEGYFQDLLQTESPTERVVKDSAGRPITGYLGTDLTGIKNSADISLTIDRNIQKEISTRLERAVKSFRANKGSVIVMDPKTGAVISMVNYPDYDPNSFTDVYEMEKVDYNTYGNPYFDLFGIPLFIPDTQSGTIISNIDGQRIKLRTATEDEIKNFGIEKYKYKNKYGVGVYSNPIITDLYEPGSVFKAITTAIGIDTGEIDPNDTYYDKWSIELDYGGGQKWKISNLASQCSWRHTYIHALDWSCNVGMIDIISKIGPSLFYKYIFDFWFGNKSNITLDGETYSRIDPYEKWSRTQFFTMSFGQGIDVTMLQMAAAYWVLANGGVYMEPYIVESIVYPDGRKIDTIPSPIRRVIKEDTAKKITYMLVDGVRNGFAKKGGVAGYTIAGKTGTSQIPYKWGYENRILGQDIGHTITSYGWYAPANNPKFVLIVSIDRPRSSTYSEYTSSALFSEVAQYLLEYYKVPKNNGL